MKGRNFKSGSQTARRKFALFRAIELFGLAFVCSLGLLPAISRAECLEGATPDEKGEIVTQIGEGKGCYALRGWPSTQDPINGQIILIQVAVPTETSLPAPTGTFEGMSLPFYSARTTAKGQEYAAVLGIPYEHAPGKTAVKVKLGEGDAAPSFEIPLLITEGKYPSEEIRVANKFAKPNPKALKRAALEAKEVGKLYKDVILKKYWTGPFVYPVKNVIIKSVYGTYRVYNDGVRKRAHYGTDLKAAMGTPVYSAAPGKVVMAKNLYFTGNTVILDHGYGVVSLYAHMSKLKVKAGDEVQQGALLGLAGMTGQVTGPHVHWQCMVHSQKVNCDDLTKIMK